MYGERDIVIWDRKGRPILRILDGDWLVDFENTTRGWRVGDNVYDRQGRHVGWFIGGFLRDRVGRILGFSNVLWRGPHPGLPGRKPVPGKKPPKKPQRPEALSGAKILESIGRPYFQANWSPWLYREYFQ